MQGEYIQISAVVRRVGSQSAAVGKGRPWEENEGGVGKGMWRGRLQIARRRSRPASNLVGGICVERGRGGTFRVCSTSG